jgi:hypothetical protein
MVWVGGVLALGATAAQFARSGESEAIARFVGGLRLIGPLVFAPAPLALLASGIWLVIRTDAWRFGDEWIWIALVLFGAAFAYGAAFQSRAAIRAEDAASAGNVLEAARQLRRWAWGSAVILLLLLFATWDMVFKPGS